MRTVYFPKQKVIFFEENENIAELLNLKIVFPDNQEVIYSVGVIKCWELTEEELSEKKMYPLIPLQLFSLRKELEVAQRKNDVLRIKELSVVAKNLANKSSDLFYKNEILGEDFHKMLLAIQNLIEYLNRNYLHDNKLEEEVITMTKLLYHPEVENKGIEQGIKQGIENNKMENDKNLLDVLDDETIDLKIGLEVEIVKKLRKESLS